MNQINQKKLNYLKWFLAIVLGIMVGLLLSGNYTLVRKGSVAPAAIKVVQAPPANVPQANTIKVENEISREISRENPRDEEIIEEDEENNEWRYEPDYEPDSVIEERGIDYVVIRAYDSYWGGSCLVRYYCYDDCYNYNWYWSFGSRHCYHNRCYWRPHRNFWNRHYWNDRGGMVDVRRDYRSGHSNSFPYRPKSVKKIEQKKNYRTYSSNQHKQFDQFDLNKKTMQNQKNYRSYKPVKTQQRQNYKQDTQKNFYKKTNNSSQKQNSIRKSNSSSSRKSAPKSAPRSGGVRTKAKRK